MSVLSGRISVKLGRNISYMSGHDQPEFYNGGGVHFDSGHQESLGSFR